MGYRFSISLLAAIGFVLFSGCAIIASVDRDAIEGSSTSTGGGGVGGEGGGAGGCTAAGDCGEDSQCQSFSCDSGMCSETNVEAGTACTDDGGEVCDGNGNCVVRTCMDTMKNGDETDVDCGGAECPPCADGLICNQASDCESANCADNVCCDTPCDEACDVCSAAAGAATDGTCETAAQGADGDPSCAPYVCDGTDTTCPNSCTDPSECASGMNCVDGFCCDEACATACRSCAAIDTAGSDGTCGNVMAGLDPTGDCMAGQELCNGMGMCAKLNGQTCMMASECLSGSCVDGFCCDTACAGDCQACDLLGSEGTCGVALDGTMCTQNANFCDGVEACMAGVCTSPGDPCDGADGDGDCSEQCDEAADNCEGNDMMGEACDDSLFCTVTDTCDGNGACVGVTDPCPGPDGDGDCAESCDEANDDCLLPDAVGTSCDDGFFCSLTDTCNGAGTCAGSGTPCVGPDGDNDCQESCDENADMCIAPDPNGSLCAGGNQCLGGLCLSGKVMFVSSTTYDGDDLGSALGADTQCAARASAANLSGTFMAWFSDSTTSPSLRFTQSTGPYRLLNGFVVATNYTNLSSGTIAIPIDINEFSQSVGTMTVWTGTNADGTGNATNCSDWTSTTGNGIFGSTSLTISGWSLTGFDNCMFEKPVYCVQQ